MISSSLPLSADTKIDIVISSRNTLLTLRSAEGTTVVLGDGDLHDGSLSRYERRFTLAPSGDQTSAAAFTVSLYPASSYVQSFRTALPAMQLVALVCAIAGITASIVVFDRVQTRQLNAVSKLVDEFLPRSIQQRLIESSNHRDDGRLVAQHAVAGMRLRSCGDSASASDGSAFPAAAAGPAGAAVIRGASVATGAVPPAMGSPPNYSRALRRTLSDEGGIMSRLVTRTPPSSRSSFEGCTSAGLRKLARESTAAGAIAPLVDLHENVTVLFSDFVGFTKWSSGVSPEAVFSTLETYFALFDALALARALIVNGASFLYISDCTFLHVKCCRMRRYVIAE